MRRNRKSPTSAVTSDEAKARIVLANRLLEQLARQLFKALKGRVSLEDLQSHGAPAVAEVATRWDGRGRFEAFAAQRLRWTILRELRRATLRERRSTGADQRVDILACDADQVPDGTHDVERDTLRIEVRKAVERLPEPHFGFIDLYYYRGETMGDLAVRLGVAKSTVAERLARAVEHLQDQLSPGDASIPRPPRSEK